MMLNRLFAPAWPGICLAALVLAGAAESSLLAADSTAESEARLRQSVGYLAADELEGRGVGTQGLDKAAAYIAEQFAGMGLRTNLFHGTPFQKFEVTSAIERGPAEKNRLAFMAQGEKGAQPQRFVLPLGDAMTPLAAGGTGEFNAPVVFVGYGITAKNLKRGEENFVYDDYAGLDVQGKVVVILRKEPQPHDKNSPFDGERMTPHALFARKLNNAAEHGAAAVIFVNDRWEAASRNEENRKLLKAALDRLAELRDKLTAAAPGDAELAKIAADVSKAANEAAELSKALAANSDALLEFSSAGDSAAHRKLPVMFCSRSAIDKVLKAATGKDIESLEAEIDADLTPRSLELTGWQAVGETSIVEKKAQVKNVVAVLEGSGPLADETIVLGAHYDHLGFGGAGSLAPWTTDIHNGADDNASGTATLLEVARRLATDEKKPSRRLVFVAFTGEERGLWGSAHYTREPRFPLEKTVAMLNLDMVGRLTDDKLAVYGTGTATEFDPLVERLCQEHSFKLLKHEGGFGPSDHSSFYAKKIPVLHLFTGTHTDYHRPSDDADKLNIPGMRRVADLLVELVQAIDGAESRPTYVEIRRMESLAGPGQGDRPSFGSMPAYPNPVKDGVLLEAVREGTPADRAGIKGGDVLVKFGDDKITVLEDFQAALEQHRPGDKVKVVVRRGEKTIEFEVTLARSRPMP